MAQVQPRSNIPADQQQEAYYCQSQDRGKGGDVGVVDSADVLAMQIHEFRGRAFEGALKGGV